MKDDDELAEYLRVMRLARKAYTQADVERAIAAERERCAEICEAMGGAVAIACARRILGEK